MDRHAGELTTMRVQGLIGNSQVNRRSVPALNRTSQEMIFSRPATHRQLGKTTQAPGSPNTQRTAYREVLARPKSERAFSPQVPMPGNHSATVPEVRGFSRSPEQTGCDRGHLSPQPKSFRFPHSGGQLSPYAGSPSASPQVPVHISFAMVSPPPPTSLQCQQLQYQSTMGRRYVPQDFGAAAQLHPLHCAHQTRQTLPGSVQGEMKEPSPSSAPLQPISSYSTASARALPSSTHSTPSLQDLNSACLQQNFLVEDSRVRERSWDMEDPFYKLRQEIQTQCKLHAEMIRAEVSSLCNETGRRLHEEISRIQDAKDEEFAQVHAMMQTLDAKVQECQQKFDTCCQESGKPSFQSTIDIDLQVFRNELEAERLCRSDRISEVHDRIREEVSRMTKLIEENRTASLEAIALEHSARSSDAKELRAKLESMWNQALMSPQASGSPVKAESPRAEELSAAGDPEDMYTLYEMAREALGDTVHLRQLVTEERSERIREITSSRHQMDMLSRELNTVQALLREATAGGSQKACMSANDEYLEGS